MKGIKKHLVVKYDLVIFDFDGTLADTFQWFIGVINDVADRYRFKRVAKQDIESIRRLDAGNVLKYLDVPLWKIPMIARHMRKLMAADIHRISLFQGVDGLLRGLSKKGITLALMSSNSYENVRTILGPQNAVLIDYYECGVSIFRKKAKLKKILSKSGIPHAKSIYIGDEIRDLKAAREAKILFGGVSWGYNSVESLKPLSPELLFESIDKILDKVT